MEQSLNEFTRGIVLLEGLIISLTLFASIIWLYADAKRRGLNPWGYVVFSVLIWIIGFPNYLVRHADDKLSSWGFLFGALGIGSHFLSLWELGAFFGIMAVVLALFALGRREEGKNKNVFVALGVGIIAVVLIPLGICVRAGVIFSALQK